MTERMRTIAHQTKISRVTYSLTIILGLGPNSFQATPSQYICSITMSSD